MKKEILIVSLVVLILIVGYSCHSGKAADEHAITTDSVTIAAGQSFFLQQCSGCHNFRQDGIGPALGGITKNVSSEWIGQFIRDPKKMIDNKDPRAAKLFMKFQAVMPSFHDIPEAEITSLVAFLNTQRTAKEEDSAVDEKALKNPIPEPIASSGMVIGLKFLAQFPASSDSGRLPLARITQFESGPANSGPYVLDLRGKLYRLKNGRPFVYMDMAKLKPAFIAQPGLATGFGSFAFHPKFLTNGLLYTTHTEPPRTAKADFGFGDSIKSTLQWVLTEWKSDQPGAPVFSGKGRELLRIDMVSGIHGMQEITFNPLSKPGDKDFGMLYIGIGDGGAVENGYAFLAHNRMEPWGTILRIDPAGASSSNGHYGIPADNPFVKVGVRKALGEIFAYGFRNPHRITWTSFGEMLAFNVGHSHIESINIILPGHDYGWPIREGNFLLNPLGNLGRIYPLPADDSKFNITYPAAEYDHDDGKAISGGYEYLGTTVPALKGKLVFGDIPTGRLFFVETDELANGKQAVIMDWKISVQGVTKSLVELCGSDRVDLHFGRDRSGEIYIMTKADGRLYKLVNASYH